MHRDCQLDGFPGRHLLRFLTEGACVSLILGMKGAW